MDVAVVMASGVLLLRLDTPAIELAVQRLRALVVLLRDAVSLVDRSIPSGWTGAGHDAALNVSRDLRSRLHALAGALETVGSALAALATLLHSVQGEVAAARRVLDAAGPLDVTRPVADQVEPAVRGFEEADRRTAEILCDALLLNLVTRHHGTALAGRTPFDQAQGLAAEVALTPARPDTAAGIAIWWAGLPALSQSRLATTWPYNLGGLEGIPARIRDGINRRRLAYAIATAQRDYERLRRPDLLRDLTLSASRILPWPLSRLVQGLSGDAAGAAHRLASLRDLNRMLVPRASELLVFDPDGDGRAVVASGDVETSKALAVVVPGMTTDLSDLPKMVAEGGRLAGAAGAGVVAIAWLGYDAPGLGQVISDRNAKAGAAELRRFTAGLRSTGQLRQRLTVIGHSYGTLVAGLAARRGLGADELVLLASPGIEAKRVSDLELPPEDVWAVRGPTDPIQLVFLPSKIGRLFGLPIPQVFGPDPAAAAFGARQFNTGGAYGHSGYFTAGSQSLDNLGRIVAGRPVT